MSLSSVTSAWPPASRLADVLVLVLGALAGWFVRPLVWIVAGPFRWVALVLATASQESGYNREAAGDGGRSVGMMQFYDTTWEAVTGRDLADRTSPFWSGYHAATYVSEALLENWRWYAAALPVLGYGVLRVMWTNGISSYTAERLPELVGAKFDTTQEGRGLPAWILWRGLTLVPAAFVGAVLWKLWRRS